MEPVPLSSKTTFKKKWLSYQDQVALLAHRGLTINNSEDAAEFLSHINYYRFSGYCLAFEKSRHQFHEGVTFEQIREAYQFDCVLRDVITEALEVVELDFRTTLAYEFSRCHGPFGHTQKTHFDARFGHSSWHEKLRHEAQRSQELFVKHYRESYIEFPDLPIWMTTELMSFGALSRMFEGMQRQDQKKIAIRYHRQPKDLKSWMHHLVYVRNVCAHHARLWDRIWAVKPALPEGKAWSLPLLPGNNRLFITLLILGWLLKQCPTMMDFTVTWKKRVEQLLTRPPQAPNAVLLMGLSPQWNKHPCWM